MFADRAEIYIRSGKGGDGSVSFRRELFVAAGGPNGGDGGKGGDIIFEVDEGLNTLADFRFVRKYCAEDGENGGINRCTGKNGADKILKVPEGTVIKEKETGKVITDMSHENRREVILKGGRGGKGNQHYATATMQVRQDIIRMLELREPFCTTTGYNRPNLRFMSLKPSNKLMMLYRFLDDMGKDSCGIVYCSTRKNVVFGDGNPNAELMFIGEGPGENEDLQGEPFVGAAGKLLDDMLSIIDLDRKNCYIANIVKCRPPHNRDPKEEEQDACIDFLRNQVALIKPKILVCLGRVAAKRIIDPDYRITRDHGQWIQRGDMWMTAIYHPSALLRDVGKRPETFDDLLSIREKLREVNANL